MIDEAATSRTVVVDRIDGFRAARQSAEAELTRAEIRVPVPQRAEWQQARGEGGSVLFVARAGVGRAPMAALSASINRSRALPPHRIYRVDRWTGSGRPEYDHALLAALAKAASRDLLCLRATIELFAFDMSIRKSHVPQLVTLGFARAAVPRMYSQTLAIDLTSTEAELFARLHSKARRDVRAAQKKGLETRTIVDAAFGDRVAALAAESFRHTGATPAPLPWARIIEMSANNPTVSRIVGMFDPRVAGADSLVAFAWGCAHGGYATYEAGGLTRRAELGNTPLSYAPLWELVLWAKRQTTATTFDLGGVTSTKPADPRGGITEFKRFFSNTLVEVAEEWTLTPAPIRAALANAISRGAHRASSTVAFSDLSRAIGVRRLR